MPFIAGVPEEILHWEDKAQKLMTGERTNE
jgi:hypothetical protein